MRQFSQSRQGARTLLDVARRVLRGSPQSEVSMKQFVKQVRDTCKLLDFAIAEGLDVDRETIEVINETEESMRQASQSSPP